MSSRGTLMQLNKADERTLLATLPGKVSDKEFAVFSRKLFEVIHGQTGCNCLSGIIRVVLQDEAMLETSKVEF